MTTTKPFDSVKAQQEVERQSAYWDAVFDGAGQLSESDAPLVIYNLLAAIPQNTPYCKIMKFVLPYLINVISLASVGNEIPLLSLLEAVREVHDKYPLTTIAAETKAEAIKIGWTE